MKKVNELIRKMNYAPVLILLLLSISFNIIAQDSAPIKPAPAAVGTHAILGKVDGISIEGMVQSPSNEKTPLQIVCVFEYTDGDVFNSPGALPPAANGMVHVDKQLNGLITELRRSGKFLGHSLETLLITPPEGTILAKKLLIIGLGDRNKFTPDEMVDVGRIGMREALRLGVSSYAHASDLKDGGYDSPTGLIITNVLTGAFQAYETELFLQSKHATTVKPMTKLTLLAGQIFYAPSGEAINAFVANHKK